MSALYDKLGKESGLLYNLFSPAMPDYLALDVVKLDEHLYVRKKLVISDWSLLLNVENTAYIRVKEILLYLDMCGFDIYLWTGNPKNAFDVTNRLVIANENLEIREDISLHYGSACKVADDIGPDNSVYEVLDYARIWKLHNVIFGSGTSPCRITYSDQILQSISKDAEIGESAVDFSALYAASGRVDVVEIDLNHYPKLLESPEQINLPSLLINLPENPNEIMNNWHIKYPFSSHLTVEKLTLSAKNVPEATKSLFKYFKIFPTNFTFLLSTGVKELVCDQWNCLQHNMLTTSIERLTVDATGVKENDFRMNTLQGSNTSPEKYLPKDLISLKLSGPINLDENYMKGMSKLTTLKSLHLEGLKNKYIQASNLPPNLVRLTMINMEVPPLDELKQLEVAVLIDWIITKLHFLIGPYCIEALEDGNDYRYSTCDYNYFLVTKLPGSLKRLVIKHGTLACGAKLSPVDLRNLVNLECLEVSLPNEYEVYIPWGIKTLSLRSEKAPLYGKVRDPFPSSIRRRFLGGQASTFTEHHEVFSSGTKIPYLKYTKVKSLALTLRRDKINFDNLPPLLEILKLKSRSYFKLSDELTLTNTKIKALTLNNIEPPNPKGPFFPETLETLRLKYFKREFPDLSHTNVRRLVIESCAFLVIPKDKLPHCLNQLIISNCSRLAVFPDLSGKNIQYLQLRNCGIREIPESTLPDCLNKLIISGCENLVGFPDSKNTRVVDVQSSDSTFNSTDLNHLPKWCEQCALEHSLAVSRKSSDKPTQLHNDVNGATEQLSDGSDLADLDAKILSITSRLQEIDRETNKHLTAKSHTDNEMTKKTADKKEMLEVGKAEASEESDLDEKSTRDRVGSELDAYKKKLFQAAVDLLKRLWPPCEGFIYYFPVERDGETRLKVDVPRRYCSFVEESFENSLAKKPKVNFPTEYTTEYTIELETLRNFIVSQMNLINPEEIFTKLAAPDDTQEQFSTRFLEAKYDAGKEEAPEEDDDEAVESRTLVPSLFWQPESKLNQTDLDFGSLYGPVRVLDHQSLYTSHIDKVLIKPVIQDLLMCLDAPQFEHVVLEFSKVGWAPIHLSIILPGEHSGLNFSEYPSKMDGYITRKIEEFLKKNNITKDIFRPGYSSYFAYFTFNLDDLMKKYRINLRAESPQAKDFTWHSITRQ